LQDRSDGPDGKVGGEAEQDRADDSLGSRLETDRAVRLSCFGGEAPDQRYGGRRIDAASTPKPMRVTSGWAILAPRGERNLLSNGIRE
jgi:hypothetical protein